MELMSCYYQQDEYFQVWLYLKIQWVIKCRTFDHFSCINNVRDFSQYHTDCVRGDCDIGIHRHQT